MSILFGLLTALSNALAVSTQHIASTSGEQKVSGWHLFLYLARQPLWLFGWLAMAGSLVFQSLALHFGPLSVVQPLLVSELIIALALRRVWLRQSIRLAAWVVAALTGLSLLVFLRAASPVSGALRPTTLDWVTASAVSFCIVAVLVLLGQRGSPARRAGLFASATAVAWAMEATFIKATTDVIASVGVLNMFGRWPIYALILTGVAGLFCEQSALHVGPLSVSQPFIVIVDPIVSVALGIWIYHEQIHTGSWHLVVGAFAFLAMGTGVLMLTRLAPPSMNRDVHRL